MPQFTLCPLCCLFQNVLCHSYPASIIVLLFHQFYVHCHTNVRCCGGGMRVRAKTRETET